MAVTKLSISMEPELRAAGEALAQAEGVAFSTLVADALRRRLNAAGLLGVTAEWQAEHGAFTDKERAAARVRLGLDRRAKASKKMSG